MQGKPILASPPTTPSCRTLPPSNAQVPTGARALLSKVRTERNTATPTPKIGPFTRLRKGALVRECLRRVSSVSASVQVAATDGLRFRAEFMARAIRVAQDEGSMLKRTLGSGSILGSEVRRERRKGDLCLFGVICFCPPELVD